MKKIYTLLFFFAITITSVNAQTVIAQWNFDADLPASMNPSTGSGTFTTIGGVENNLNDLGAMPAGNPGKAYSIKTFPEQGTASGTAGFQFNVSTANYSGITVSFDPRGSGTASRWQQYEYSTDGTTWNIAGNNNGGLLNDFTVHVELALPVAATNSPNFKFRIVSIFAPSTTEYAPIGTTYGAGGAWRIDNVTFTGTSLSVNQNAIAGLKIYPNPVTTGTLFINTDSNSEKAVVIFDVLGKQVLKATTTNSVNVANLNSGVYVVKITEDGKTATRKLVIK